MGTQPFITSTSVASADVLEHPILPCKGTTHGDTMSSTPWDGDSPPTSIYADSTTFIRRDDGIWCKQDTVGRLYLVNINGECCAKTTSGEHRSQIPDAAND